MSDIPVVAVAKIIEGALENDTEKVKIYAEHIARQLDKKDDKVGAKIIYFVLMEHTKKENSIVLD